MCSVSVVAVQRQEGYPANYRCSSPPSKNTSPRSQLQQQDSEEEKTLAMLLQRVRVARCFSLKDLESALDSELTFLTTRYSPSLASEEQVFSSRLLAAEDSTALAESMAERQEGDHETVKRRIASELAGGPRVVDGSAVCKGTGEADSRSDGVNTDRVPSERLRQHRPLSKEHERLPKKSCRAQEEGERGQDADGGVGEVCSRDRGTHLAVVALDGLSLALLPHAVLDGHRESSMCLCLVFSYSFFVTVLFLTTRLRSDIRFCKHR